MPNNAVEYFVSYYDYYQPEAYVPQTDTFIEKDSSINAEVERLRHSTTNSLLSRRDVDRRLVGVVHLRPRRGGGVSGRDGRPAGGERITRDQLVRRFINMQYERNDVDFSRGKFRVRGDTIEIIPVYEEHAIRIEMFGDEIEALYSLHPLTGDVHQQARRRLHLPGHPLRREPGARCTPPSARSGWNSRNGSPSSSARASCSRHSGSGCAPVSTSR